MGYRRPGRHTKLDDLRGLIRACRPEDCGRDRIRIGGEADGGYVLPDDS